jgi:hypothetical protein
MAIIFTQATAASAYGYYLVLLLPMANCFFPSAECNKSNGVGGAVELAVYSCIKIVSQSFTCCEALFSESTLKSVLDSVSWN